MKRLSLALFALMTVVIVSTFIQAQTTTAPTPQPYVLEVTYFRGHPLAFVRIGEGYGVFALYERIPGWKPTTEIPAVTGVRIASRYDGKTVRVEVACRDAKNPDNPFMVGEYAIAEDSRTTVKELTKCGIVPFELAVVRAPVAVAELPIVDNKFNSLQVSVAPNEASLPSFKLLVLNNSPKPVLGFSYVTLLDGKSKVSGLQFNLNGAALIQSGESVEKRLPSELKLTTYSNGEIPETQPNLVVSIPAVVFADRTYEGRRSDANTIISIKGGEKMQVKRILEALRSKPESMNALITALSNLATSVDEADFKEFVASQPDLSPNEIGWARSSFASAAQRLQKTFYNEAVLAGKDKASNPAMFQSWLGSTTDRYQKWFDALP